MQRLDADCLALLQILFVKWTNAFLRLQTIFKKFTVLLQLASLSLNNCIALKENLVCGPQLKIEIISFLNVTNEEQNSPFDGLKYVVKCYFFICYANSYVALTIILTMSVSVAKAEKVSSS